MICPRPWSAPPAVALALCLLAASCIGSGSPDEDAADVGTTTSIETGDGDDAANTTTTVAAETTLPTLPDLTDAAWVVNDFDGLVDDRGRVIVPPPAGIPDASRPTVVRAVDGSIYYVLAGRLWRRAVDAAEAQEIEIDATEVRGVTHDGNGNIIVNTNDGPEIVAEGAASERSDLDLVGETTPFITASNGVTVRAIPPDADVDDLGYVTGFRSPARLEVERNGEVEWTIDAGGVQAPWLGLIDFDGRFVMMARYPTEPADPMMQHIVYDLDCRSGGAAGGGCTRTFHARWGTAALVGPDREPNEDDLNMVLLDVCPTMGRIIDPPAEMTDPGSFADDFTGADLEAFRLAALQLATCDSYGLGDPQQPGLLYVSGSDDPAESGWMWTDFARSLRGPFVRGSGNTVIWSRHDKGPAGVLDRDVVPSRFDLVPGRRQPDHLVLTVSAGSTLLTGRTDTETAERVVAAVRSATDQRNVPLTNQIDTTGAGHESDLVDEFLSSIEGDIVGGAVGEIHLTANGVVRNLADRTEPTAAERDLGFLMADFASGGEGVYDELPLADDVMMALGSEVVARRQPTELFRRSAWVLNSSDFAGRVGPFNLLDLVPSPLEVVVGPHARCAGADALPSPPELAAYRRIGILPLEGSVESCLDWSAVDLFVDDQGVIRGLSLDLSEP